MNQVVDWLEKASHKVAIFLITLAFVTSAIALLFTPSAAARSLTFYVALHQTTDTTGSWTRSSLPQNTTQQGAPDRLTSSDPTQKTQVGEGFFNTVKRRVGNAVGNAAENTKNAFGGIGEDVQDTLNDASEPVRD